MFTKFFLLTQVWFSSAIAAADSRAIALTLNVVVHLLTKPPNRVLYAITQKGERVASPVSECYHHKINLAVRTNVC